MTKAEQLDRFIKTARELGVDETGANLSGFLRRSLESDAERGLFIAKANKLDMIMRQLSLRKDKMLDLVKISYQRLTCQV